MQQRSDTLESAITLAQQRWAALNDFDLSIETWESLFSKYKPGDILEAVRTCKHTRDYRPEKRYQRFLQILEKFSSAQPQDNLFEDN